MFKGLISEVANEVGRSAALIINQIFQWYKSNTNKKIYRTNQELHDDLCGIMSTATIQRCKKRLIEKGYIEVSFDKGLNRVTHYSLTPKAIKLLDTPKSDFKHDTDTKGNSGTTVPPKSKTKPHHAKTIPKSNVSQAMKQSFDEQGKQRSNVVKGIPDTLKNLLKGKKEEVVEEQEELTQNEYDECDLVMLHALRNHSNNDSPVEHNDESLTLGSLVGTVFKQAVSEDRKKIYQMGQIQYRFSEDY